MNSRIPAAGRAPHRLSHAGEPDRERRVLQRLVLGDLYTFFLKVGPGDVIEDISYFTTGCGFGTVDLLVARRAGARQDDRSSAGDRRRRHQGRARRLSREEERLSGAFALRLAGAVEDYRAGRPAGRITDAMLEQARGIAAAAAAASRADGTGTTEEDAKAGPQVVDAGGDADIKLH